ncbi:MAG TPA: glycosyltransferase family 2 protein [Planctomycetaceae bacterium]|nr:glycosyltransferase family 2 protein [Planctomycetaceae bacterium]
MTPFSDSATSWPRVSVIIPTYNRASLVCAAIESVLGQGYPNLEVLVIDDGSTDDTAQVVARFGTPVRYVRQSNAGAASARNRGIELATGELVAFLDSDDLFLPGKLKEQVQCFQQQPALVLVYCWFSVLDEWGRCRLGRRCRLTGHVAQELLAQSMQGPLATPTVMVRRPALFEAGLFDESMTLSEDTDLWCRLARRGPIALIPEVLVQVRRHSGNLSFAPGRKRYCQAAIRILNKAFDDIPNCPRLWRMRLCLKAFLWSWLVAAGSLLPLGPSFWLRAMWTNPLTTLGQWLFHRPSAGSAEEAGRSCPAPAAPRRVA